MTSFVPGTVALTFTFKSLAYSKLQIERAVLVKH